MVELAGQPHQVNRFKRTASRRAVFRSRGKYRRKRPVRSRSPHRASCRSSCYAKSAKQLGLVGPNGVRIVLVGFGLVSGLKALGAAWRLIDGKVALRADSHGLIFHPSFYNGALNWNDVESVKIGGRHPARIIIQLKRRFWSLTHPFSGRDVQLNIIAIGSSYRSAETAVRKMRHWQES